MTSEITEAAKRAIETAGANGGDWRQSSVHAAALPADAGALQRVLRSARFAESAAAYDKHSAAAEGARDRHKTHATRAALAGFGVAVLAGGMLYHNASPATDSLAFVLAAAQFVCILVALWSAFVITFAKPYNDWSRHRSAAEHQRLAHFKMLLSAEQRPLPGELPLEPLALEYMRVFLLDDQRDWFRRRAADYLPGVRKIVLLRLLAILLIALAALPGALGLARAPFVEQLAPQVASASGAISARLSTELMLLVGVVGGALQTLVTSLAATSLANRNAESYARMAARLQDLSHETLEAARKAAADGEPAGVSELWRELVYELAAEHREWNAAHRTAQLLVLDKGSGLE